MVIDSKSSLPFVFGFVHQLNERSRFFEFVPEFWTCLIFPDELKNRLLSDWIRISYLVYGKHSFIVRVLWSRIVRFATFWHFCQNEPASNRSRQVP